MKVAVLLKDSGMEESWLHKKRPGIKTRIERGLGRLVDKLLPPKSNHKKREELDPETRERIFPPRIYPKSKKT